MGDFHFKQGKDRPRRSFQYADAPERPHHAQHHGDGDVAGMLKKIQQQLSFLERKIDMLLGNASPKPFRSEHRGPRAHSESGEHGSGERSFHKGKKPFFPKSRTRH